jgi:hypothetical protein
MRVGLEPVWIDPNPTHDQFMSEPEPSRSRAELQASVQEATTAENSLCLKWVFCNEGLPSNQESAERAAIWGPV